MVSLRSGIYETYAPDIVFLDIDLPQIDGLSVLDYISKIDSNSFIVMLTASPKRQDVEHSLKKGAIGCVLKPFTKQ